MDQCIDRRRLPVLLGLAMMLAGCSAKPPADNATANATATPAPATPAPPAVEQPAIAPPAQNIDDPASFVPLQSGEVKNAIHRALQTGQTQRWQDGKLSGYAVPSQTTGANGCRAVRYTVDQRPGAPYESITACDAH